VSLLSILPGISAAAVAVLDRSPHSALSPAGPMAANIEWLYWVIFWITFVAFVVVILGFARAAARNRSSAPEMLPIFKDPEGDRRGAWAVGSAVTITVLTLFAVLFMSVITGKKVEGVSSSHPITIQVTGHQWWWEAVYPNPQADQTVITANEIHVPVRKPVVILTNSADVIHSFWAPSVHGKRDLLPGYSSAFWIQIDQPGTYPGRCAEFCGLQHAHMGFSIVAEDEDKFEAWEAQQVKPAADPGDAEAVRGRQVFLTHACLMCHTIRGTDAGSRMGPDLTHLATRKMIAAETLPNTRGALAGWIVDPQRIKPGAQMAPNPLDPDDLQALITYLQTLQ
jgi:cytochrome c oxidase subunit II